MQKLDEVHELHTSNVEREERRDQVKVSQLRELSLKINTLTEIGGRVVTEHRLLESLCFKRINARQERIVEAHEQTFQWVLHNPSTSDELSSGNNVSGNNFMNWLETGSDIFWISGKAGSGKSTLMKYISSRTETRQALERWSNKKEVITASFYFWFAGTELQKSQKGLLQSLLYEILSQCRILIPTVLPKRWEECTRAGSVSSYWSRTDLNNAFTGLSKHAMFSKKFCFFIDGLDEYDGDHNDVIDLIQSFTASKQVKVCLSSRPWNVFEVAFGQSMYPRILLEELTQSDIESYVHSTLEENRLFYLLKEKEYKRCDELVDEIICRAQGVFLWVFLVVRSLLQGLTNADRIIDLQKRLRSLPNDLVAYFRHMLGPLMTYTRNKLREFSGLRWRHRSRSLL